MWRKTWTRWLMGMLACLVAGEGLALIVHLQGGEVLVRVLAFGGAAGALLCLVGAILSYGQPQWKRWWLGFAGVFAAKALVAGPMLYFGVGEVLGSYGAAIMVLGAVVEVAMLFRGLSEHRGARLLAMLLIGSGNAGLVAWLFMMLGQADAATVLVAVTAMTLAFVGLLWVVRQMLWAGRPVFGVARTLIDEAVRMRIAMIFVFLLVFVLAVLPVSLSEDRPDYQMYRFLAYSLLATSFLLGVMTIFLACATITREISQRQIFLTMTKPVSRGEYLLGKWLGIVLLNLVLVGVSGLGIYVFAKMLQARTPPGSVARQLVNREVMTARETVMPEPTDPSVLESLRRNRVEQLHRLDPQRYPRLYEDLTERQRREVEGAVLADWHSIAPGNTQSYVFRGLDALAGEEGKVLHLRVKPRRTRRPAGGDDYVYLAMRVNGNVVTLPDPRVPQGLSTAEIKIKNDTFRTLLIRSEMVTNDGRLQIDLMNLSVRGDEGHGAVRFKPDEGLQLLYPVGSFEGNFARSMVIIWVQLILLGTVGLAAGTALSFPVATVVSLMIFLVGVARAYVRESLQYYTKMPKDELPLWDWLVRFTEMFGEALNNPDRPGEWVKMIIALIGKVVVALMPGIGDYDPSELVADGRLVSTSMMGESILWLVVLWGGLFAVVGWLLFRRRELAAATE